MKTYKKKKMLYIMGIDWKWIYQRPQIIAEYLSRDFDVTVAYPIKLWDRITRKKVIKTNISIQWLKLWMFPFQGKCKLIGKISDRYISILLRKYKQYQYIYINYPIYIKNIPKDYKGWIIYDCIDEYTKMCTSEYMYKKVKYAEEELIERSHVLLVSSQKLYAKLSRLTSKKIVLVRNGAKIDNICHIKDKKVKDLYDIGYIGTIAKWFDNNLIAESIENCPNLVYHLIGPNLEFVRMDFDKVIYEGTIEHFKLNSFVKHYDCLIMPFVVNDIVKSVDPVKFYEYISFGKCIVSVYYEELDYFKDFVYFYTTHAEYDNLMKRLISEGFPPKYNSQQQKRFLFENSWENRYEQIGKAINNIEEEEQNESDECIWHKTRGY